MMTFGVFFGIWETEKNSRKNMKKPRKTVVFRGFFVVRPVRFERMAFRVGVIYP